MNRTPTSSGTGVGPRPDLPARTRDDIPDGERDQRLQNAEARDAEGGRNSGPSTSELRDTEA